MTRFILLLALLVAVAVAPKTVEIQVGGSSNVFTPASVTIEAGDSVKFVWAGGDHTVTESQLPNSCVSDSDASGNGFVDQTSSTNGFSYTFQPENNRDMYFFCENHCDPNGAKMAGEILFEQCEGPQPDTCPKVTRKTVGEGETCDRSACMRSAGFERRVCGSGLSCERSRTIDGFYSCERETVVKIGGNCAADNAVCVEGLYNVDCEGNDVCGNDAFLTPGEACTTEAKPECDNDDCCASSTCTSYPTAKCPSGFCCEFAARGESCAVTECSAADYCTPITFLCAARNPVGTVGCDGIAGFCAPGSTCVANGADSSCVDLFSVPLGGNCDNNDIACEAGLYCGDDGSCKAPVRKQGEVCTVDSDCGAAPAECDCNEDDGELQCDIPFLYSSKLVGAIENFVECAAAAGCTVDTTRDYELYDATSTFFPGSCLANNCKGQTERVISLANAAQSAASSVVLTVTALVAAVVLVL